MPRVKVNKATMGKLMEQSRRKQGMRRLVAAVKKSNNHKITKSQRNRIEPGRCRICGCTEFNACSIEGDACSWYDETMTLCDNPECVEKAKGGNDV